MDSKTSENQSYQNMFHSNTSTNETISDVTPREPLHKWSGRLLELRGPQQRAESEAADGPQNGTLLVNIVEKLVEKLGFPVHPPKDGVSLSFVPRI